MLRKSAELQRTICVSSASALKERREATIRDLESLAEHPELDLQTIGRALDSFKRKTAELQEEITVLTRQMTVHRYEIMLRKSWDELPYAMRREVIMAMGVVTITPECLPDVEWGFGAEEAQGR